MGLARLLERPSAVAALYLFKFRASAARLRVQFGMEPIKTGNLSLSLSWLAKAFLPGVLEICTLTRLPYTCVATSAVEDAIQIVAGREAVFYDPGAHKWVSSIPGKALIRTRFGEVATAISHHDHLLS